jgi:hypothetical protein
MAGERVRCECGTELEVPTLRGLNSLARDEGSAGTARERAWTDRQRVIFALVVLGLAAGAVAGYLAIQMPPAPQAVALPVDEAKVQASSPDEIHSAFEELKKGINSGTRIIAPEGRQALEQRKQMTWGIRILLLLGAASLGAALATALARRAKV